MHAGFKGVAVRKTWPDFCDVFFKMQSILFSHKHPFPPPLKTVPLLVGIWKIRVSAVVVWEDWSQNKHYTFLVKCGWKGSRVVIYWNPSCLYRTSPDWMTWIMNILHFTLKYRSSSKKMICLCIYSILIGYPLLSDNYSGHFCPFVLFI